MKSNPLSRPNMENSSHNDKQLLTISGLTGTGKSALAKLIWQEQIPSLSVSKVVGDFIEKTTPNLRKLPARERVLKGYSFVLKNPYAPSKILLDYCSNNYRTSKMILVEGIRSPRDLAYFKMDGFKVISLFVHSSFKERAKHIRKRDEFSSDRELFDYMYTRDILDFTVGIDSLFLFADYVIINEGIQIDELVQSIQALFQDISPFGEERKLSQSKSHVSHKKENSHAKENYKGTWRFVLSNRSHGNFAAASSERTHYILKELIDYGDQLERLRSRYL